MNFESLYYNFSDFFAYTLKHHSKTRIFLKIYLPLLISTKLWFWDFMFNNSSLIQPSIKFKLTILNLKNKSTYKRLPKSFYSICLSFFAFQHQFTISESDNRSSLHFTQSYGLSNCRTVFRLFYFASELVRLVVDQWNFYLLGRIIR